MTLVVEDGSIVSGANSYASLAQANAYHSAMGNATWTGTDAAKEAAILRAMSYIEGTYRARWKGIRTQNDQPLTWPRYDVFDEDGYEVPADEIHQYIIDAVCEAALRELVAAGSLQPDLDRGGAVKEVTAGPVGVVYADYAPTTTLFQVIENKLQFLTKSRFSVSLMRA